jgi:acyl-coenzyme A synthetase/AMP-(fatty) acid ligase
MSPKPRSIGIPDDKSGEAVKAIVVMKPGKTATATDIINFTRERIAGFKTPKTVDFLEARPPNPSGKIMRRHLRDPYWAGKQRQVNQFVIARSEATIRWVGINAVC